MKKQTNKPRSSSRAAKAKPARGGKGSQKPASHSTKKSISRSKPKECVDKVFGCTDELDGRVHPPSETWKRIYPPRLRKLSALRAAHLFADHEQFKAALAEHGAERARDLPPKKLGQIVQQLKEG